MSIDNIQQYIGKIIVTDINLRDEELQKLRYIANQVDYCHICYAVNQVDLLHTRFLICGKCNLTECGDCRIDVNWILDDYIAEFCSEECRYE